MCVCVEQSPSAGALSARQTLPKCYMRIVRLILSRSNTFGAAKRHAVTTIEQELSARRGSSQRIWRNHFRSGTTRRVLLCACGRPITERSAIETETETERKSAVAVLQWALTSLLVKLFRHDKNALWSLASKNKH